MNNWYNRIIGTQPQAQSPSQFRHQNNMQQMQSFMSAIRNPVAFIKQNIPGIPDQAFNDPTGNAVLQYMMNNLGVTQQDIQKVSSQIPRF